MRIPDTTKRWIDYFAANAEQSFAAALAASRSGLGAGPRPSCSFDSHFSNRRKLRREFVDCLNPPFRYPVAGTRAGTGLLGRFMDQVLTAELIARVYYHALYRATSSQILRQICRQLLRDEVFHVYFHTQLLRKIRNQRLPVLNSIWNSLYRLFHAGTILIVWIGQSAVMKKGGFSFLHYLRVSRHCCEQAINLLQQEHLRSDVPRRKLCGIRPS